MVAVARDSLLARASDSYGGADLVEEGTKVYYLQALRPMESGLLHGVEGEPEVGMDWQSVLVVEHRFLDWHVASLGQRGPRVVESQLLGPDVRHSMLLIQLHGPAHR